MTTVSPSSGKSRCDGVHDGAGAAGRDVVAVEGDVEVAERDLGLEQVLDEAVQAAREDGAATMDADQRDLVVGVLLDDLMGDPHQGAAHVVMVEDDLVLLQSESLPGLSGPG